MGNTVAKTNTGSFVGAFLNRLGRVVAVDNTVIDSNLESGILVGGNHNVVKGNRISNSPFESAFSEMATVFVEGVDNTIKNNTINEAFIGLQVSTANNVQHNFLFNIETTEEVFVPGPAGPSKAHAPSQASQVSLVAARNSRH